MTGRFSRIARNGFGDPLNAYAHTMAWFDGHLYVGKPFSVSHVEGAGANATITKWTYAFPGEHVDGIESWLYPIQPPH